MVSNTGTRRSAARSDLIPTATHWGNYLLERCDGNIVAVHPYSVDAEPSAIGQSLIEAQDPSCRIPQPMIRQGYLKSRWESDGEGRGRDPFVPVSWKEAIELAAAALEHTRSEYGNEAIYGGSYGWSSAGRFHHAQSQIHRFLSTIGGYTYSVNTYSLSAAENILPHVVGRPDIRLQFEAPTVEDMVANTGLVVGFGGIATKNAQVMSGGLGAHTAERQLQALRRANVDFINISPIRDDMVASLGAEWWPCRPNADVAIMLGIAHTLATEELVDHAFVQRYCVGYERFLDYLLGSTDNRPKNAVWASTLAEVSAEKIRNLARRMAKTRTVLGVSWSLQRAEHGEQPYWMVTTLAAMLGYIGLPGGGIAYGYGSVHNIGFGGRRIPPFDVGSLPRGKNLVTKHIPVSRIADMLLHPGESIDFNGQTVTFPDIKTIYWAGGNPFHHHQDLNRLVKAWSRPETIIVNEPFWTATARYADIVFPCTSPLERNDFANGLHDCYLTPMPKAIEPFSEARNDYDIFSDLASLLGCEEEFTEGRDEMQWIQHLYAATRSSANSVGIELPSFDAFWSGQQFSIEPQVPERKFIFENFRQNPKINPLQTPSGRIELYSETIASFNYDDCRGYPCWYDKEEWLGSDVATVYPLHLISNQPRTRLHSQYDHAKNSQNDKIQNREQARMHPTEATNRGIRDGDVVRLFNKRGACLAGIRLTDSIRPGVVELATGAWYDPLEPSREGSLEVHGNPNVLTRDIGTSKLAQGPTAHSCLVEVERFDGPLPPIKVFDQPLSVNSKK